MAKFTRYTGTGAYFPEKILTNHDMEKIVDTNDEWIVSRTGIHQRHISDGETTAEMGAFAAKNALDMAGLKPSDIDGVIFATLTPDTVMPSTACRVQEILGMSGSFAFDLAAACTGFIYSTGVADSMIKNGLAKNILLIGAERMSSILNWEDRTTCVLFGDGAGAAVISASDEPGIRSVNMSADGNYNSMLQLNSFGTNYLAQRKDFKLRPAAAEVMDLESNMLEMRGNEVFKVAVRAMADAAEKAVQDSGLPFEAFDYLIAHQANLRIIDAAAKRCKMDKDKVIINLDRRGNTSAATIPTALDETVRDGRVKKGTNIISAAFGGGLTWGAMAYTF